MFRSQSVDKVRKHKTIKEVVKNGLCNGCGTCVSLCPCQVIELFIDDSKGIYLPKIDQEKCNQCGICFDICPGHSMDFKGLNIDVFGKQPKEILAGNYLTCYSGHATDHEIRYHSASGGLVTALLIFALEEGIIDGALVTKMSEEKPLEPQPFIARTKEEILSASKSKYCPIPANVAIRKILETEGKYAVVGLPCHIHGLRKAEIINRNLKERILLHIGIFCGTTKSFLATEFQLRRMGIQKEQVVKIDYRGEGWPGSMTVKLKKSQKNVSSLYYDYYDNKFGSFTPWRCTVCIDQTCELADVSFGDAWLPEIKEVDKIGTSIIISRNKKGEHILQQMACKGHIELRAVPVEKVIESLGELVLKRRAKACLNMSRLMGKKVPLYVTELFPPSFRSYLNGIILYSMSFLASNRSSWWLLNIYDSILKRGGVLFRTIIRAIHPNK